MRELLFSVTIKDCDVDTFRSGGPGGQNQNKVESGVRITHRNSGAVGESRETRDQLLNKRKAFRKMVETPIFKKWHKIEIARRMGQPSLLSIVKKEMNPNNIIVETKENNKWTKNEMFKPTLQEIDNLFEENNNE